MELSLPSPSPLVRCWWIDLERDPADAAQLSQLLSAEELGRAARFGRAGLRDRYIAGRASVRTLLGSLLGVDAASVSIRRGARGRPAIEGSTLDFNVSHTEGRAVLGVVDGMRIGVDLEHESRRINVDGVARRVLTQRERGWLAGLDEPDRRRAFLRLWTCKEAMSKATGDGLSAPMRELDVDIATPAMRLVAGPAPYLPAHWSLHPIGVPSGFLATIALWQPPAVR